MANSIHLDIRKKEAQVAEVGADKYMPKPFDPDEILATAAEVLGIKL